MGEDLAIRFQWHPVYKGQALGAVTERLRGDLAHDQRAYALALEGAEEHEDAALASVIELEKRWGEYDFGWAEIDPKVLADRIVEFEWAREKRQELFPFSEFRASQQPAAPAPAVPEERERPWWAFWRR